MANGTLTAEEVESMGMCWTQAQAQEVADQHGGKTTYSVKEILNMRISYADAMSAVCRTEVTPGDKLRAFAAEKAQNAVTQAAQDFGSHEIFAECVAAARSGDAERMQQASRKVHRLSRQLFTKQPDNRIGHLAVKCIRACVHADAGEAALGAASHAAERAGWVGGEKGLEDEKNAQRQRLGKLA